jgi:uncharacterized membrane protein YraQ (UPF0718 family)
MNMPAVAIPPQTHSPGAGRRWHLLEVGFLVLALAVLALGGRSPPVRTLSLLFSSIVLEALPFMLLGALVGGLVETFVTRERMISLLPRREWLAVLAAASLGMVLPVCECAVVPVVRRLARKGLPVPAVIAYLLGAPIANPIVAASTAVAYRFDWLIVGSRLAVGYAIAVGIGLAAGRLSRGRSVFADGLQKAEEGAPSCGCDHRDETEEPGARGAGGFASRVGQALRHAADDFVGVGHYFVMGAFVAALAQTFISRSAFLRVAAQPAAAIVLMMALAVAINLCSEADAFVASSFRGLVPTSAQMAFLLLGPILDLKLLLMYQALFRRRVILILAGSMIVAVLAAALALHATGRYG